ncbi:copper resistance CopC family protein [Asanoa iriomotensis]|uniref:Copper resistance protein n=1 Tax=Asanoa iriomotensis TaxID=234613 RepID=A0ABQ4BVM1_9ACTN|nr:copper resistance CopC family protein [Asanoa iriomotensis]GIF54576.1 copper resistance protein [Asanoa iriomotensis]
MTRWWVAAVMFGALTALLAPAPAWAHNELRGSNPTDGARLSQSPTRIVVDFAERLDPKYTRISVSDAAEDAVVADPPTVTGTRAVQPLGALAAGAYTVAFRVVSVDGHPVQGSVTFSVTASAAATSASGSPTVSIAAVPQSDDGALGPVVVSGLAAVAVVLVAGFLLLRRRRDRMPPS